MFCFALIFPPAFLMGFPMPIAMTSLARLGKDHMFLWAWGINGCFSVIGAALVPIIATSFGLNAVLMIAGVAYLLAMPAFFAVLLPLQPSEAPSPAPSADGGMTRTQPCCRVRTGGTTILPPRGIAVRSLRPPCCCKAPPSPCPAPAPKRELAPLPRRRRRWFPSRSSPFPYRGDVPDKNRPFLDVRGRASGAATLPPRGGTYWEDQTYSDQRVLLHIPKGFDPRRPALMVVFFHGNEATLTRDVRNRQAVPRQVTRIRAQRRAGGAAVRGQCARIPAPAVSGSRACSRNFSTRQASG